MSLSRIKTGGLSAEFQNGKGGNLHSEGVMAIMRKREGITAGDSSIVC
ncbi:MAG: hypothetical protein ACHQJX_08445 [Candidatus Acidiferrales bacterium]